MNQIDRSHLDEVEQVAEIARQLRDDASLREEARREPEALLDRLGLTGEKRAALSVFMTALAVSGVSVSVSLSFWQS